MNHASLIVMKKLQDAMRPQVPGSSANLDNYPAYIDGGFANWAASAKFAAFGNVSRYVVRLVLHVTRYEHVASPTLSTAGTVIFCFAATAS